MLTSSAPAASASRASAGRDADAALDVQDVEPAVVEQLLDAALGGHEVVRVVDVPEERALLEVVGHDDEEHAAGPQRAERLGGELARRSMPFMCSSTWSA